MKIKVVLGTCIMAVWGGFISVAAAEDSSVVVDLSVLDRLSPAPQTVSAPQPLFPVVKKSAAKKAVRKKTVKKAAPKKPAQVKVTVKETVTEKLVIPAQSPQDIPAAPAVENPETTPAVDQVAPGLPAAQPLATVVNMDKISAQADSNDVAKPTTDVPAQDSGIGETAAPEEAQTQASAPQSLPVVIEEEKVEVVEVEPVSAPQQMTPESGESLFENADESLTDSPAAPLAQQEAAPVQPTSADTGLLIDEQDAPIASAAKASHRLLFEPDVSELSPAQQQQVDEIIASFKDASKNKIAIIAYNQDNGVDSFRKKRLCLDRVVKIRSYLLQKGYKDFAVKVINVDSSSDRANVVEIEEM